MKSIFKFVLATMFALAAGFSQAQSFSVVLQMNESMVPNRAYYSPNGRYYVVFQASDGNLVVYKSTGGALWASGARGGTFAVMQPDANFVIYKGEGIPANAVWASHTGTTPKNLAPPFVSIWDDGSLHVVGYGGGAVWKSPADPNAVTGGCTVARQYPVCVFPGTMNQFNSWVLACSIADAQRQAAATGAVYGACR